MTVKNHWIDMGSWGEKDSSVEDENMWRELVEHADIVPGLAENNQMEPIYSLLEDNMLMWTEEVASSWSDTQMVVVNREAHVVHMNYEKANGTAHQTALTEVRWCMAEVCSSQQNAHGVFDGWISERS